MPISKRTGRFKLGFVAIVVTLCGLVFAPRAALAHAVLVGSHPAANSEMTGPDITILLKYNARIDRAHSTLTLLAPDGKVRALDIAGQSSPNTLASKATGLLSKGAYVLRWQVLASDGHITRGEIPFRVR